MYANGLTPHVVTKRIKPDGSGFNVAAGATNVNSDVVDTSGFEGVRFTIGFGPITAGAVTSIKVQQGAVLNMSDAADLIGTGITVADTDDNKVAISDVFRPEERYVRLATLRATQNSVIDFVIVELYGARVVPVTQDATSVISAEVHNSPIEGTA